jgi:hypothetical protein
MVIASDRAVILAWLLELILHAADGPGAGEVLDDHARPQSGDEAIEVRFHGKRFLIRVDEAGE